MDLPYSKFICFEKAYKGGGDGRIGTTERAHQLEKVGKHSLKESTL